MATVDNQLVHHRYRKATMNVGDEVSFRLTEVQHADQPTESFTHEDLEKKLKAQPIMQPAKIPQSTNFRVVGNLEFRINETQVGSFELNTENTFSVAFRWLGDRNGTALLHIALDGFKIKRKKTKIKFGDVVVFRLCVQKG